MDGLWWVSTAWLICCVLAANSRQSWARKGQCEVCKNFVKAFQEGLRKTEKSNYAGGDTSWEEEKLGAYANSEVRLVEILDGVCNDFECHHLLEENEEHVERWWFKLRRKGKDDLKLWFCHDHLDVCCPENTYGPTCRECPGGTDEPCGGHGTCEGAEEKDGIGKCSCHHGYKGRMCHECDKGHYNDSSNCLACHRACDSVCDGPSASDCTECANGYRRSEEGECKDVNECKKEEGEGEGLCEEGKYCFNTPGSHRCNDCDKSCKKACTGAGPARCLECASGYSESQYKVCKDRDECEEDEAVCAGDTYCENTAGSYMCRACHVACYGGCQGAGPANCSQCKDGFTRKEEKCEDVDECDGEELPCDTSSETCHNLIGSFSCKCKHGLVRKEGICVARVTHENEKKKRKKKKKTKKGGKGSTDQQTAGSRREEEEEEEEEAGGVGGKNEGKEGRGGVVDKETREHGEEKEDGGRGKQEGGRNQEESHDQPDQSHDQPNQSHDQPNQSHDQPSQSHDQSPPSKESPDESSRSRADEEELLYREEL